jgi:hypothetical protein
MFFAALRPARIKLQTATREYKFAVLVRGSSRVRFLNPEWSVLQTIACNPAQAAR